MPRPRFRFTVRRMMILVAIVALVTSAGLTWERRSHYRRVAAEFARRETSARRMMIVGGGSWSRVIETDSSTGKETGVVDTQHADYYARMREKYERAAGRPWMLVGPDPFEPE